MKNIFFLSLALIGTVFSSQRELQFDNEFVRVWKTTIAAKESLKDHRHDTHRVVVALEGGTVRKVEDSGEISVITFESGKAYWLEPDLMGNLIVDLNEGDQDIVVMVIELKNFNAPGHGFGIDFINFLNELEDID